ncbi:MAG: hypothetical protein GX552_16765 [Chloroflexi bacterium]|jgi:deoxyadenosine/deoxycytidine kinase|nr:hypothetical protein [Chloroflexota bacterium]
MCTQERKRLGAPPEPIPGRISVVGVCSSGKTTLVEQLQALGYDARQTGQEHSHVPDMWQRISRPQVLIYLDVSLPVARQRGQNYESGYYDEQRRRLAHARQHSDLFIDTTHLTPQQILEQALAALQRMDVEPS